MAVEWHTMVLMGSLIASPWSGLRSIEINPCGECSTVRRMAYAHGCGANSGLNNLLLWNLMYSAK